MKSLITNFYTAFQQLDAAKMSECYHYKATFEDPAFGQLNSEQVKAMWSMLCGNATDLKIEFSQIEATDLVGSTHWEARYTFSKTNRKVHNYIDARFDFQDGKIIRHIDHFDLHRWAGQALGLKGKLLGGTAFFRKSLQKQTRGMLDRYMQRNVPE